MVHAWPAVDMDELRDWRRTRVMELMRAEQIDHVLLSGFDNIRYVTDFRTQIIAEAYDWFAAVVDDTGSADVFVPWVDEVTPDPDPDLPNVRSVVPLPSWTPAGPHADYWVRSLARYLAGAKRVGYELLNPEVLHGLAATFPDTEFMPISTALYDLRQVKHPTELLLLEHASIVNANGAQAGIKAAESGMTDHDILSVIMGDLQRQGVEFLSHSLCNHRRGTGTWFAAGSVLKEGDPYFFDIGCYGHGGYASDIARTGFIGEPRPELLRAWNVLMDAYELGQELARPGVRASEVHEAINAHLTGAGLPHTPYSMGHGVGLRACELPTIHRADRMGRDQQLQLDSVISLEPETAVEIDGQLIILKIEDNFAVEADGLRLLSHPSQTRR
jgi:Xaa-Pro dipeptidase